MSKIVSDSFLGEVAVFVGAMRTLLDGFASRAVQTMDVLHADDVAKLLVTRLDQSVVTTTRAFFDRLDAQGLKPHAVVANGVEDLPPKALQSEVLAQKMTQHFDEEHRPSDDMLREFAQRISERSTRQAAASAAHMAMLERLDTGAPVYSVPIFSNESEYERLASFGSHIWQSQPR